MPKLTKQQIIILAVMVAAIIFAAYDFYSKRQKKAAVTETPNLTSSKTFAEDIAANMAKYSPSVIDAYIVGRAEAAWKRDPFLDQNMSQIWSDAAKERAQAAANVKQVNFIYTGYLESGKKKFAIINGTEYAVGNAMTEDGYVVKNIDATKVVIEKTVDGTTIDVLLQD